MNARRWGHRINGRPVLAALLMPVLFQCSAFALEASPLLDYALDVYGQNLVQSSSKHHHALVLDDGFESFVLRVHLVRSAKTSIDLQTFIWADEETSRYFENELKAAADRGVKIRLLVDHMWSTKNPDRLAWNLDYLDNIEIKLYRPMANRLKPSLPRKIVNMLTPNDTNQRMHTKVMLVDGVIGITGGRNVGNNYFDYSIDHNFKDREIAVMGPALEDMARSFEAYWRSKHAHYSDELIDVARRMRSGSLAVEPNNDDYAVPYFQSLDRLSNSPDYIRTNFVQPFVEVEDLEYVWDEPGRKTVSYFLSPHGGGAVAPAIRKHFLNSTDTVLVQSPYVILNRRARRTMRKVKKRSPELDVKVSTNSFGAADHLETYSANFRLRTKVIRGLGFEVYEYKPHPEDLHVCLANFDALCARAEASGMRQPPYLSIHSKTFVFDEKTAFIGTYNLDPRSFYINNECGVFVHDETFARDVAQRLIHDMGPANSWVIARKESPLSELNLQIEGLFGLLPIDLWPVRYTSSFELKDGDEPVPPDDPEFYNRYRDLGSFPGSDGLSLEVLLLQVYKGIGKHATPIL